MTTQFLLSILGLAIAGGGLGLGALYALYKWKKKNPLSFNGIITMYISTLILLGAISGYSFLTSSWYLAKKGVHMVVDTGQEMVSSAISFGLVTIIDGFGKTSEHYEKKWEKNKLNERNNMEFKIIGLSKKSQNDNTILHITFSSKNNSEHIVKLNDLIKDELILLKDKKGLCFPLTLSNGREITIAPHASLVSEVDVVLPQGVSIQEFVTPNQQLSIGR